MIRTFLAGVLMVSMAVLAIPGALLAAEQPPINEEFSEAWFNEITAAAERTRTNSLAQELAIIRALSASTDPRAVPALVKVLKSERVAVCSAVVRSLGEIKDPRAAQAIAECARFSPLPCRLAALKQLATLQRPADLDIFLAALEDDHAELAEPALDYLGKIHDGRAVPALKKKLADRKHVLVIEAWKALKSTLGEEVDAKALLAEAVSGADDRASCLLDLLDRGPEDMRAAALQLLAKEPNPGIVQRLLKRPGRVYSIPDSMGRELDEKTFRRLFAAASSTRFSEYDGILHAVPDSPGVRKLLFEAIGSPNPIVREKAIRLISSWKQQGDLQAISRALDDPDWNVRESALDAMVRLSGDGAVDLLAKMLKHPDARLRRDVVYDLSKLGTPAAQSLIRDALRDENQNVRFEAIMEACRHFPDYAPQLWSSLTAEPEPKLRLQIGACLAKNEDPARAADLLGVVSEREAEYPYWMSDWSDTLQKKGFDLRRLMDQGPPQNRAKRTVMVESICLFGAVVPETIRPDPAGDGPARALALRALQRDASDFKAQLATFLRDPDEPIRYVAITKLKERKDLGELAEPMIGDPSVRIRKEAFEILRFGAAGCSEKIVRLALQDGDPEIVGAAGYRCLSKYPQTASLVIKRLADPDPAIREAARGVLASGAQRAEVMATRAEVMSLLREAVRSPDAAVRNGAELVLVEQPGTDRILFESLRPNDDPVVLQRKLQRLCGPIDSLLRMGRQLKPVFVPLLDEAWNPQARSVLREAVKSSNDLISYYAGIVLTELRDPAGFARLAREAELRRELYSGYPSSTESLAYLFAVGWPGLEDLCLRILEENEVIDLTRLVAADYLGRLGTKKGLPALRAAARKQDLSTAIETLGRLRDREAIPDLVRIASEGEGQRRAAAVRSLGQIGGREVLAPLLRALSDYDPGVRRTAADGLGSFGGAETARAIIAAIPGESPEVRKRLVWTLSWMSEPETAAFFRGALASRDLTMIAEGYPFYIRAGIPGSEELLIEAVNLVGYKLEKALETSGNPAFSKGAIENSVDSRGLLINAIGSLITPDPVAKGPLVWGSEPKLRQ